MKALATSLLLFLVCSYAAATPGEVLVVLDKTGFSRLEKSFEGEYTVYAFLEAECLIGVDPSVAEAISAAGIAHSVLARDMQPGSFYLVTPPPHGRPDDLISIPGLLHRARDVGVLRADRSEAERLSSLGFGLARLMPLGLSPAVRTFSGSVALRKRSGDGFIERLVAQVSADSLLEDLRGLEGFRTRYSYTDSCQSAGQWLYDRFESFGVDASFHYYDYSTEHWQNVVGTIPGKSDSTVMVVLCGHFDSISEDPWNLAPGAEDNGSGTALVLEAARVLASAEHDFTLKFICFSGEEQGLVGSYYYVTEAFARGDNIVAALNMDMVGYTDDEYYDLSVRSDSSSIWLGNLMMAASRFTQVEPYFFVYTSPNSDHWYFQQYGYPATFSIHMGRTHGYPFYHSIYDTVGNLNPDFLAQVTRMAVASLASIGNGYPLPPLPPESVRARDAGTGGALQIEWSRSASPGVVGYNVYSGVSPRRYGSPVYAGDATRFTLSGLEDGKRCFVSVTAIDDNSEGGYSREASEVPGQVPRPPDSLSLLPIYLGMDLFWRQNPELDLRGYNVYRGTTSGGPYDLVNVFPVQDTTYRDSGLLSGETYYYVVTAMDTTDLESGYSSEKGSVVLSFDHGILVVDETKNGSGGTLVPDSVQDSFYERLLRGYEHASWDCDSNGFPGIAALGSYSTILWRSEDIYEHPGDTSLAALGYYLSQGGNLWMIGWKLVGGIMPVGDYPFTFSPGEWPLEYLRLSYSDNTGSVGLLTAQGEAGCPSVSVDSSKAPPGWNGVIYLIDTAVPLDGDVVLRFCSNGSDTTFDGEPIATRYTGSAFKVFFFGFPLYYMRQDEAQAVADAVLGEMGEPKGIEQGREAAGLPSRQILFGGSPNPFSFATKVRALLTGAGGEEARVLRIYDVTGRLVRVLRLEPSGSHMFEATWNGEADDGRELPGGTYFCRLPSSTLTDCRKLILIR